MSGELKTWEKDQDLLTSNTLVSEEYAYAPKRPSTMSQLKTFFTPEILQRSAPAKLRSTAYLDGLRGLAAFIVYVAHHILAANTFVAPIEVAFGHNGVRNLVNFPILRMMFTGSHASVPIFFIVSGYVQSRKSLQMIHENDSGVYRVLASGLFRRWIRLFVPVLGTAFVFMTLWHVLGITPYLGHHEKTYLRDLEYFLRSTWYFTYPFKTYDVRFDDDHIIKQWFPYNGHTWTVPWELQGSIHTMIYLLMFSKSPVKTRMSIMLALCGYYIIQGGNYWYCFPAGVFLCEADLLSKGSSFLLSSGFAYRKQFFWALLFVGLYLGGVPVRGFDVMSRDLLALQPGFYYIPYIIPTIYWDVTHYLGTVSATCIVTAVIGLRGTHWFFETRILQYLGRISFSLYLCHGPVLSTLGILLYRIVGKLHEGASTPYDDLFPIPQIGPAGLDTSIFAAQLIILPATLYASELCLKLFDGPSIKLAQWAWNMVN